MQCNPFQLPICNRVSHLNRLSLSLFLNTQPTFIHFSLPPTQVSFGKSNTSGFIHSSIVNLFLSDSAFLAFGRFSSTARKRKREHYLSVSKFRLMIYFPSWLIYFSCLLRNLPLYFFGVFSDFSSGNVTKLETSLLINVDRRFHWFHCIATSFLTLLFLFSWGFCFSL